MNVFQTQFDIERFFSSLYHLSKWNHRLDTDGLTSLPGSYRITQTTEQEMYTNISVDVTVGPENSDRSDPPYLWWADWDFIIW